VVVVAVRGVALVMEDCVVVRAVVRVDRVRCGWARSCRGPPGLTAIASYSTWATRRHLVGSRAVVPDDMLK
jgi:hypothetical protein